MHEKLNPDTLHAEIERGNFVRAVLTAEQMSMSEEKIKDLQRKALGNIAAVYRNVHGTKQLAQQYGYSKEEVKQILEEFSDELKTAGNTKPLEPCYDYRTGHYLSFDEWMTHYSNMWDRI
jgi:hypothetical protein